MNKNKKLINILAALSEDVTVRDVTEECLGDGTVQINISVDHAPKRPLCICGSKKCRKHGTKKAWTMHIPQGERKPTRIFYDRQRYICKACGKTILEHVDWIYNDSHLSACLARNIENDLKSIMTKNDIARINGVSVHYVDYMLKMLTPPMPSHLPDVICLDETFSEVEEQLSEKTSWVRFVTNLSDGETGELLDVLPYRNKKRLVKYFKDNFPYEERCKVNFLCCDSAKSYMSLADNCFPNAVVCLDNFHITKRILLGFFKVRTKQQDHFLSLSKSQNDRYHKEYTDLKRLAHKFVTTVYNQEALWGSSYTTYADRIRHHLGICPELKDAYAMVQCYYEITHLISDYGYKARQLDTWISIFGKSTSEHIASTVKYVEDHLPYIHNAWEHGYSNAVCEGNNNIIQTIKSLSFGIHSFDYFRTRSLLIAGRPGVARAIERHVHKDYAASPGTFFFDEFPSLENYALAYDWSNPSRDFSKEGA